MSALLTGFILLKRLPLLRRHLVLAWAGDFVAGLLAEANMLVAAPLLVAVGLHVQRVVIVLRQLKRWDS